ncbi:hypothetical protein [Azospirillum doebereinerae]
MFTITIGPARPRMTGENRKKQPPSSAAMLNLARIAARHAPTMVLDGYGGAMILGATATAAGGSVDLF